MFLGVSALWQQALNQHLYGAVALFAVSFAPLRSAKGCRFHRSREKVESRKSKVKRLCIAKKRQTF